jgi:hypothetical protein
MKEYSIRTVYGFTPEQIRYARERANGHCEFPAYNCQSINTGRVNHLTGCNVASLEDKDPTSITNVEMNGLLLCETHERDLDQQEHDHILFYKEAMKWQSILEYRRLRKQQISEQVQVFEPLQLSSV